MINWVDVRVREESGNDACTLIFRRLLHIRG